MHKSASGRRFVRWLPIHQQTEPTRWCGQINTTADALSQYASAVVFFVPVVHSEAQCPWQPFLLIFQGLQRVFENKNRKLVDAHWFPRFPNRWSRWLWWTDPVLWFLNSADLSTQDHTRCSWGERNHVMGREDAVEGLRDGLIIFDDQYTPWVCDVLLSALADRMSDF